jgi:cell fate (sporulation/competence/biofilm development) regulator YlbF (YheA/YmcA/DUF963 family)
MESELMMNKADAIADLICQSESAVRYWKAKDKMEFNTKAQELFEALKLKTNNQLGLQQSLSNSHPKAQQLAEEIHGLERQLYEIPVAMQYKEAQAELNELVQGVMHLLLVRLSSEVPVEYGPKQGCGKGPDGNGCNCGGEGHGH